MALVKDRYTYVDFRDAHAVPLFAKTTNAIATAADDQEDYMWVNGKDYFEHKQTGQNDALQYIVAAAGWTIPCDGADGDGVEITQGMLANVSKMRFTTGVTDDPGDAFFIQVGMLVDTIAAQDVYGCGFRKIGAYVDITTPSLLASVYDDKAFIGVNDNSGNLVTITSIAGTDTTTELTAADVENATYVYLRVNVSSAGAVTYLIGQSTSSAAAAKAAMAADASAVAMTFADNTVVVPYFPLVSTGTLCNIDLIEWECGLQ